MDRELFSFIKKKKKATQQYPLFWIVFIWHSDSLTLLSFIPHLSLEKLKLSAQSRSVSSTPSFLTLLHPFPAQSMEDSWWWEGWFIWGVSSKPNCASFGHSEFLFFIWSEIVFALNTCKCLVEDNIFANKTNTAAPKGVLLLTSKNPGRNKCPQKNTKKPNKPNTIIIMTLVVSNGGFFSKCYDASCCSSSMRIVKTLCKHSPSGTHNQGGLICKYCFHSASSFLKQLLPS